MPSWDDEIGRRDSEFFKLNETIGCVMRLSYRSPWRVG